MRVIRGGNLHVCSPLSPLLLLTSLHPPPNPRTLGTRERCFFDFCAGDDDDDASALNIVKISLVHSLNSECEKKNIVSTTDFRKKKLRPEYR